MADITVTVNNGEGKAYSTGITVAEVLKDALSSKARKAVVAVRQDDRLLDLGCALAADASLATVAVDSAEGLEIIRHSAAHIMAEAVLAEFGGDIKVAIGPAVADGFYYDFDRGAAFTPDDFARIEARMQQIVSSNAPFTRESMPVAEAISLFEGLGQPYKVELLREIEADQVTVYRQGGFVDLCRGPHVPHAGFVRAFKLISLAGAYWRGNEKNQMLQRIYGTAFADPKDLKKHLHNLEEAKKRDHRKLGRELELFSIQEEVGPGLILWLPKGALIRKLIEDFWRDEHYRHDYDLLFSPHIAKLDLWKTSGHLDFYGENMYSSMDIDEVSYQLKPMNCPFHINAYNTRKRSYREFPLRWCELGTVYRYERTGVLHGLLRVRGFTQDDAHIFCRPDQLDEEIYNIIDLTLHILKTFGFDQYDIYLSTRPEKYVGDDLHWEQATLALKNALERKGLAYEVDPGEGVFYGPKIDIKIKDVLGRSWQCSTIQVDFNLPERFNVRYTGEDGTNHQPIMVHRALMGSLERFFGVLIEHYAGAFPLWLAPVQARVMNITDAQGDYVAEVYGALRQAGIRVEKDERNEKLNYKIREAQMVKIPYMLIVGDKEKETRTVTVRLRDGKNLEPMPVDDFIALIRRESVPGNNG